MSKKLSKEDLIKLFELLIEKECSVHTHPEYRGRFNRDENLIINQVTRQATNNVAYKTVDFDLENMSDEEFWSMVEGTKFNDVIENNAAAEILKMAGKFNLLN